ncbi:glycosyltransferase, partial [archaeon]|nr:glycosyltransferase [archaeon]
YNVKLIDNRHIKNRYDDMIVTITKKEKFVENKIAVFYHLGQFGQWERLFQEQMNSLVVSGLYQVASFIHIGVNGNDPIPMELEKFKVVYNQNQILEADTLKSLYDFCKTNPDYRVLYFHTKGSTQESTKNRFNVDKWRLYLEYFNIHQWKKCIQKLKEYDTVGTEYSYETGLINQNTGITEWEDNPHYAGNYWWANARYINSLDPSYLYNDDKGWARYRSEFWIGTGNPKKYNFYQTNCFDKYQDSQYLPTDYVFREQYVEPDIEVSDQMLKNKKAKFVMITMFKNESKTIKRMLESCYKYIDYYVIQDNGSTDGTPEIVEDFFKDKNIPGFVYKCEEGWVGFGWNRDHLLQKCLNTDHGCDWIIKMDCDETLSVDDDFDWSVFDDKNIHAFHVPAIANNTIYQRAWIWNARLQWKFNHDTAHETIELINDGIGANFRRHNLPSSFKQIGGFDDGESWQVPTKYVSDALKLEEKLIRENTLLTDLYHFWYVGKSYYDCFREKDLPLKQKHSKEFARRCIFNFKEFLNYTHNFDRTMRADRIDEMGFYASMLIGNCYHFLKEYDSAIWWLMKANEFCPVRNENYVNLALVYEEIGDFEKMLGITNILVDPNRANPFPGYSFIIDTNSYYDTGNYVQQLHELALSKNKPNYFKVNDNMKKRLWVVDDFYVEPDKVREYALSVEFSEDKDWYKGIRSKEQYNFPGIQEAFEKIMGMKLKPLDSHGMCGRFQICTAQENIVYHYDSQAWAAMIYLTPNAPVESGTMLLKSKITGARNLADPDVDKSFERGFYDGTQFDVVDKVGNVYNRLVIMDARCIHAACQYFGTNKENSR